MYQLEDKTRQRYRNTIGQRKGLNIGGKGDAWFVVGKDPGNNIVFIEQGANHPALFSRSLTANELSWVDEVGPIRFPFHCTAKVRYRQSDEACIIDSIEEGVATVTFENPQRAVTPRQSVVFYQNDICLGGGMIIAGYDP